MTGGRAFFKILQNFTFFYTLNHLLKFAFSYIIYILIIRRKTLGIINIFTSGLDAAHIFIYLGAWIIAIVVAIVCHEFAHSYAAVKMGDLTPKYAGRLTLNPAKHFDALGFVFLILIGFGWAKPVPINSNNFRNIRKGEVIVALSGILTNLVLCIIFTLCYSLCALFLDPTLLIFEFLQILFYYLACTNLIFAVFNLLPLYPLDGFNLVSAFCRYDNKFLAFMRQWSWVILLVLLITGALGWVLTAFSNLVIGNLLALFGMIFT